MTAIHLPSTVSLEPSDFAVGMELSTDFDHRPALGDDIDVDVDLDLTSEQPHDQDGDYMLEDARSDIELDPERLTESANDDVMQDGDYTLQPMPENTNHHDEDLHDAFETGEIIPTGPAFASSPLLEDYEVEPEERTLSDPAPNQPGEEIQEAQFQDLKGLIVPANENHGAVGSEDLRSGDVLANTEFPEEGELGHGSLSLQDKSEADPRNGSELATQNNVEIRGDVVTSLIDQSEDHVPASDPEQRDAGRGDESAVAQAHVHPVIVVYEGTEVSLFPPSNDDTSETFFLRDEALAGASISELFGSLRSVLAESLAEEDELEISLEELGIRLGEDSLHAQNTTLSRLLDLHMQLHRQDGLENPDALYMTLSTKKAFSKRLNYLITAAAEGKGISQLDIWDDEGEESYEDEDGSYSADAALPSTNHEDDKREAAVEQEVDGETFTDDLGAVRDDAETALETANAGPEEKSESDGAPSSQSHNEEVHNAGDREPAGIDGQLPPPASDSTGVFLEGRVSGSVTSNEEADDRSSHGALGADTEVEAGDFIDYEEEENSTHAKKSNSQGSSTVRADDAESHNELIESNETELQTTSHTDADGTTTTLFEGHEGDANNPYRLTETVEPDEHGISEPARLLGELSSQSYTGNAKDLDGPGFADEVEQVTYEELAQEEYVGDLEGEDNGDNMHGQGQVLDHTDYTLDHQDQQEIETAPEGEVSDEALLDQGANAGDGDHEDFDQLNQAASIEAGPGEPGEEQAQHPEEEDYELDGELATNGNEESVVEQDDFELVGGLDDGSIFSNDEHSKTTKRPRIDHDEGEVHENGEHGDPELKRLRSA